MIKTTLTGVALALALVAHSPSQAQAGGKKELVAKVLQLQQPGIEAMARQMAEQPAMQLMQQYAGQDYLHLLAQLKRVFDPQHIISPGRYIGREA